MSYNRNGVVNRDSAIATVRLGYADGYPRRLGNGVGKVWVKRSPGTSNWYCLYGYVHDRCDRY